MTRLYLVRHATHGLVDRVLAGRMPNVSLSPAGIAEAEALGRAFAERPLAAVLSSPLERCRETAARIAAPRGLSVEVREALNEIDCGEWTGRSFADLAHDPRWQAWNGERGRAGVPGGETFAAVAERIAGLVSAQAVAEAGEVACVTHADVIKAALLALLDAPLDHHHRLAIDPASVTTLEIWPGGGRILRSNERVAA